MKMLYHNERSDSLEIGKVYTIIGYFGSLCPPPATIQITRKLLCTRCRNPEIPHSQYYYKYFSGVMKGTSWSRCEKQIAEAIGVKL